MKKRSLFLIALALLGFQSAICQVTDVEKDLKAQHIDTLIGWRTGGVISVAMAQTSLTNWSAGGENSMSTNGLVATYAKYHKGNMQWDNSLGLAYGMQKQGTGSFMKTNDVIDITSKYGQRAFSNFYYSGLVSARSQFSKGYNYPNDSVAVSNFMSPGYLTLALGLDYKPNAYFSAFVAPVTGRFTFVNDSALSNAGAYGVQAATRDASGNVLEPGKHLKQEFGGYVRLSYSKSDYTSEILKNVSVTTRLDLFSNYLKEAQNIDVNWETLLGLQINKFLMVNVTMNLIYDDNIKTKEIDALSGVETERGAKVQFKEILGVGLAYKW